MKKASLGLNGWGVLFCFAVAAGLSQFLWLNFAPILSLVQSKFHVSEAEASLLLLVFPVTYVIFSIHAGSLTDRKGYRTSLLLGTGIMAVFAWARLYLQNFWVLLAAQTAISVAQPYVVNAISKLVLDWFEKKHEALATGLGTVGLFVGMALGLALTPPLVAAYDLSGAMMIFALISSAVYLLCYFGVRTNPKKKQSHTAGANLMKDFKTLIKSRDLVLVFVLSFVGLGYFNGLTTWLEPILAPQGMDSAQAGIVGGVLILGGIFGSALVPALSDYLKMRKPVLAVCIAVGALTLYPFTVSHDYASVLTIAAIQGFFFLPAFALLLEMASELAGPKLAGSATGILMMMGNAGAVVVIVAMEVIKGDAATFDRAIIFLLILLATAVAIATQIKETFKRH